MAPASTNVEDTDEDMRLLEEFIASPLDSPAGAKDVEESDEELRDDTEDDVL